MINDGMFSSNTNEWATPMVFFEKLNQEFHFTLDPCSTKENAKCSKYFTKDENGLAQNWGGEVVFCNPPYGRSLHLWVKKAHDEHYNNGTTVVMLIPARTDTSYFHEYIYGKSEIRFVRGRLNFNDDYRVGKRAPFPSMVVIYK